MFRTFAVAAVLFSLCLSADARAADAAKTADAVEQILNTAWMAGMGGYDVAKLKYDDARAALGDDVRLRYALALSALKGQAWDEAAEHLDAVIAASPRLFCARRARIWLSLYQKQSPVALTQMEAWVAAWPESPSPAAEKPAEEKPTAEQELSAEFAGKVAGFLAGPGGKQTAAEKLAAAEAALKKKLTPALAKVYDAARQSVAAQYESLGQQLEEQKSAAQEAGKRKQESDKDSLGKDLEKTAKEIADLTAAIEEAKTKGEGKAAEATAKLTPLQGKYQKLLDQARPLQNDANALNRSINQALAEARNHRSAKPPNNAAAERLEQQARLWTDQLNQRTGEYRRLESEGKQVESEIRKWQGDKVAAENEFQAFAREASRKLTKLQRAQQLLKNGLAQTDKPASGASAATSSTTSKMQSLVTYIRFPLDEEKQRFLALLGK